MLMWGNQLLVAIDYIYSHFILSFMLDTSTPVNCPWLLPGSNCTSIGCVKEAVINYLSTIISIANYFDNCLILSSYPVNFASFFTPL